jgi:hypothetical protein
MQGTILMPCNFLLLMQYVLRNGDFPGRKHSLRGAVLTDPAADGVPAPLGARGQAKPVGSGGEAGAARPL